MQRSQSLNPPRRSSPDASPARDARTASTARAPDAAGETNARPSAVDALLETRGLSLWFGTTQVLREISIEIPHRQLTALIGAAGSGKTSLLRCFNRMYERVEGARLEGEVRFRGRSVHAEDSDLFELRRRIAMIFREPNPFPMSIRDNVLFGPRLVGSASASELENVLERSLRRVKLWERLKDRLGGSAWGLSRGEAQRLSIARSLAVEPSAILLDEPGADLDPIETRELEELLGQLKADYTLVLVTHNLRQAARTSDHTAFLSRGRLIEFGETPRLFVNPRCSETQNYISGHIS